MFLLEARPAQVSDFHFVKVLEIVFRFNFLIFRSEWIGLHGMVTQKNPDENVNHLPSVTLQPDVNNSENNHNAGDDEDISKRFFCTHNFYFSFVYTIIIICFILFFLFN